MKARLTMRAALVLGMPALARGVGRIRHMQRALLSRAGHEAGRGNILTAAVLVAAYAMAM